MGGPESEPEQEQGHEPEKEEKSIRVPSTEPKPVLGDEEAAITPKVDMYFETEDDAYEFYRKYAEHIGFTVRKSNKSKNTRHSVTRRLFVCSKQGFRQEKKGHESRNPRPPGSRTGCGACLCIKIIPCGAFRVTDFIREHNHPLARQPTVRMVLGPRAPLPEQDPKDGPDVDMHFETEDDAYAFYNKYAEHVGFSVRRSYKKRKRGLLVSRIFVCSCEGIAEKYKDPAVNVKPGPTPTRTGCQACMVIKVTACRTYRVSKFIPEHNHPLENPDNVHKLRSHKSKTKLLELDLPEYKRRKRKKGMLAGDVGATLEYLQALQNDNPSLYYTVGVSGDGKATNFFWTDMKAVMDFGYFNDILCFDTTYSVNNYNRPFALFVGVDNQRQMIVFGSALLYDDSTESLKWLFQAFTDAMRGQRPGTVLTDEGEVFADAMGAVWPDSAHRVSAWHVYHNARKHLKHLVESSKSNFMNTFSQCLFECEEDPTFVSAWEKLVEKYSLGENDWIDRLFKEKESWALPYGRHIFSADVVSTLRKENMVNLLRKELNEQEDVLQFLKQYENILDEYRLARLPVDSEAPLPIPTLRMLRQVGNAYTIAAFKMFQAEFEAYMNSMAYPCGSIGMVSEYKVSVDEKPGEHTVKYDSLDGSITCSCKRFESTGIQCCHVLKVLDLKNIKELPAQYIIPRWTKEARSGPVGSDLVLTTQPDSNPKTVTQLRYQSLCRIASMIAARAIKADEAIGFIESQSNALVKHLDNILHAGFSEIAPSNGQHNNLLRSQHQSHGPHASTVLRAANGILGV